MMEKGIERRESVNIQSAFYTNARLIRRTVVFFGLQTRLAKAVDSSYQRGIL